MTAPNAFCGLVGCPKLIPHAHAPNGAVLLGTPHGVEVMHVTLTPEQTAGALAALKSIGPGRLEALPLSAPEPDAMQPQFDAEQLAACADTLRALGHVVAAQLILDAIAKYEAVCDRLVNETAGLRGQLGQCRVALRESEAKLSGVERARDDIEERMLRCDGLLGTSETAHVDTLNRLADVERRLADVERDRTAAINNAVALSTELYEMERERDELRTRLRARDARLSEAKELLDHASAHATWLREQLNDASKLFTLSAKGGASL